MANGFALVSLQAVEAAQQLARLDTAVMALLEACTRFATELTTVPIGSTRLLESLQEQAGMPSQAVAVFRVSGIDTQREGRSERRGPDRAKNVERIAA